MKEKSLRINTSFLSLVVGFVLGFLISFAFCWKTIIYIIDVILAR